MTAFDEAFEHTVSLEGGYSNHAADRGGATNYGITEAVARENGYTGQMSELPLEKAKEIYQRRYWKPLRLDDIAAISKPIALKLFDIGVNMGTGSAAKFAQRALNVFNRQQADYPDMTMDGAIGPKTVTAFIAFMEKRKQQGGVAFLKALTSLQGARYIELAENREQNEAFVFGWLVNRA
ncbi:glycoside hydrolase family 108 protein [Streptomyces sp. NPDC092295]|uniref:glycoside hydrolase family 108 protein n=1 Tax=Streptomyces sp. NPDC092295 TaxID=3366011 RepID=UPI0037FB90A0